MTLNYEQLTVVNSKEPHIFLLACAGSGKTRVIVEKIKSILNENNNTNILCLTFTKKSALEMKERINNNKIKVHTFHSLAYEILIKKEEINLFENKLFDLSDLNEISIYKNGLSKGNKPYFYDTYESFLKENNLLDFDDILLKAISIKEDIKYDYLFIDEFQDTNLIQFKYIEKLIGSNTQTLLVGDPDQSIYKFRGSKVELIDLYINKFQAKLYTLSKNYRSSNQIIDVANKVISKNTNRIKKIITPTKISNIKPLVYIGDKSSQIKMIIEIIKSNNFKDVAVLYRNHYQVSKLKQELTNNYLYHVSLLSFHESKGLEFDTVIIFGVEDLPYNKNFTLEDHEEERRLFFVGITRAKNSLYLFSTIMNKFLKETKIKSIINI